MNNVIKIACTTGGNSKSQCRIADIIPSECERCVGGGIGGYIAVHL
jgi:hypothetical protein